MHKAKYKSNFELKFLARMQTGRYLGILIGSLVLSFIISIVTVNIISTLVPANNPFGFVINYILVFIAQVFISVLNVGLCFIFLKSACNMSSTIGDLFCGFQKDPVKALKIGAVISAIDSICMLPLDIASIELSSVLNSIDINKLSLMIASGSIDSYESLAAYNVFYSTMMKFYLIMLVCALVSLILTLPFFPAFYMVLDFPGWNATTILKKSFEVMHGNKMRLFLLYLSFIPLYFLCIVTCGLALLWVIPYTKMAVTNFYLDMMAVRNKSSNN